MPETEPQSDFQSLQAVLDELGWPHEEAEPGRVIQTLFAAERAQYNCYIHLLAERRQILCYSVYPRHVPPDRIHAVAECVARANWDLIWGNFELNLDNGGLRFKTSLTLGKADLQPALLRPLTLGNVSGMFRFQPSFDALIDSDIAVRDALALAV